MFLLNSDSPVPAEPILDLPKLPGDWRFEGRKLVYDGPHTDEWAILLTVVSDLIAKSR